MLNKETKIVGLAWRYNGIPTIAEYNAFIGSVEAVLKAIFTDGRVEEFKLEKLPHCPLPESANEHYLLSPLWILAGDVERWEAPKQVRILRLLCEDGSQYFLEQPLLAQKR